LESQAATVASYIATESNAKILECWLAFEGREELRWRSTDGRRTGVPPNYPFKSPSVALFCYILQMRYLGPRGPPRLVIAGAWELNR